jgi:hypothetical protein
MRLRPFEVDLLRSLRDDLAAFLTTGATPGDAVTGRLFPPTVVGDDDADQELRGLIHDDLLRDRLDALDSLTEILDRGRERRTRLEVTLRDEEPVLVLGVLNDIRLALAARVGIEDLDRDVLDDLDESTLHTLAVVDHLAGLQEQLLGVLDPESVRHYDEGHDLEP